MLFRSRVFGRERLDYWLFDPARFPGGDVVRDFLKRHALEVADTAIQRSNESLSRDGLCLLYIYRKYGPGYGKGAGSVEQNWRLQRALRGVGEVRLRLAESVIAPILDAQAQDIAWMSERLGEPLREPPRPDAPGAITSEDDPLNVSPSAVRWLASQLGDEYVARYRADLPLETVAEWVHELRERLAPQDKLGRPRDRSRLVRAKRAREATDPGLTLSAQDLLGDGADADAVRALQAVLEALGRHLESGLPCNVPGLGRFSPGARKGAADGAKRARMRFEPDSPTT